ncbi:MAG: thiopurine S-methyltransferase [Bacteriovoracaceae bacterium]
MDKEFWEHAWEEGRTGFHQSKFNDKLLTYFPELLSQENQKVLVPLCGKSKDMLWLAQKGLEVRGIELYEDAVKAFFTENKLPSPEVCRDNDFVTYSQGKIRISSGDFFKFHETATYDLIYDRAALVALPPEMRKDYVTVLRRALKPNGKYLLLTYEYDESELQGPPFSIPEGEVRKLYENNFSIKKLESQRPNQESARFDPVTSLKQTVYILTLSKS